MKSKQNSNVANVKPGSGLGERNTPNDRSKGALVPAHMATDWKGQLKA